MGQLYSLFARAPDLGNENRAAIDRIMNAPVEPAAPGDNVPYRAGIAAILKHSDAISEAKFAELARAYAMEWTRRPDYPLRDVEVEISATEGIMANGERHVILGIVGYRK